MPAQTIDPRLMIRTNPDGSPRLVHGKKVWTARVSRGFGVNGERKRKRFTRESNNTKEVQRAFEAWVAKLDHGGDVEPSRLTVAKYFQDWVNAAKARFAGTSYSRYENINRNHVIPKLGAIAMQKLTARHLNRAYAEWRDAGLSEQTVTHHHRFIHRVLAQAEREGVVRQNVAAKADKPKPAESERRALTVEEVDRLFTVAHGTRLYPLVVLAVATGCRRGELLGAKWADLDVAEGVLHVRRSLEQYRIPRTVNGKPMLDSKGKQLFDTIISEKPPKNGKARAVALTQGALDVLRAHRLAIAEKRIPGADAYIFPDVDGVSMWTPHNVTDAFRELARKAGLVPISVRATTRAGRRAKPAAPKLPKEQCPPTITFHTLRHTCATLLLASGCDVRTLQEQLGHSAPATTLRLYVHTSVDNQKRAVAKLNNVLVLPIAAAR
jgi:integrase